jgi:hypothetical protein
MAVAVMPPFWRTTLFGSEIEIVPEHDRFKWEQESSRFFEKKRRKKLLLNWACGGVTSTAQFKKFFCFFLFTKRSLPLRLDMTCPKPIRHLVDAMGDRR